MMKYPVAKLGNAKLEYYAVRYGCYLRNIRFEEYDVSLGLFLDDGAVEPEVLVPTV